VAVTCPTAAVSHVMLEAYKKYLLVGLLVHGDRPKDSGGALGLPKFTSAIVGKFLKPLCVAYSEIVTAYHGSTAEELRAVVAKYQVGF
jgi:COP9 signalosome complex subunit 3